MRILAIDHGTKRIGIAVSDPGQTMAHPLKTVEVRADGSHLLEIIELARSYQAGKIVVGLPYNMDGTLGTRGEEVCRWAKELEEATGLPVVFWDERLSSFEAEDLLMRNKVNKRRRKGTVDKIAAGIILQGYLDSGR
jgi:putative Holliday junction resolvase